MKVMAGSWHEPIEKVIRDTIQQVKEVKTKNEILFLTHKVFLFFGKRRRSIHFHPSYYLHGAPQNLVIIRDKKIAGRFPVRILALSFITKKLCEAIPKKVIGQELAYEFAGKSKRWIDLPFEKRELLEKKYIDPLHPRHSIRRSLVNFLLQNGFGEVSAFSVTGHSLAMMQQGGGFTFQAPIELWKKQEEILKNIFTKIGLMELINLLIQKAIEFRAWDKALSLKEEEVKEKLKPGQRRYLRDDFSSHLPDNFSLNFEKDIRKNISKIQKMDPAHEFILQLSLYCHIPINYWLSFHPYTFLNSLLTTNTGQVYFKIFLYQSDAGGIGPAPLHLGFLSDPQIQVLLKTYLKLKSQAELKFKSGTILQKRNLFWKNPISKESIGKALRQIYRKMHPKNKMKPLRAFKCLEKTSIYRCFINYPGIIASTLTKRNIAPLNNASFYDVIKIREQQNVTLYHIDGSPYEENEGQSFIPSVQSEIFQKKMSLLPINSTYQEIYPTVEEHAKGLSLTQISNQLRRFDEFQKSNCYGLAAYQMIQSMIRNGHARPAKPFPLLLPEEFDELISLSLQKIDRFPYEDPALNLELKMILLLCVISGARVSEIHNLNKNNIKISNISYVFIREGKTPSAQRWINLSEFDWAVKHLQTFYELCKAHVNLPPITRGKNKKRLYFSKRIFDRLHEFYKSTKNSKNEKIKTRAIDRILKKVLEESYLQINGAKKEAISIHIIRHMYAFFSLQEIIQKHYWKGNFNSALCSLSTQMGHSSFIATLFSYVGTGCFALNFNS